MRKIVDVIEKAARRFGVTLAPSWRVSQMDEEHHMRRMLQFLNIDCVFDVGANVGQYGERLRRYFDYRGRILSFEPNPKAFAQLQARAARDPLWDVFPIALGREAGTAAFQAYAESDLGSFLKFDAGAKHAPTGMAHNTIQVQVETLAEMFPKLRRDCSFQRPFLKLDTQGFDLQVAMGAAEGLREFLGIQSEVSFDPIYVGAPLFDEVVKYYESFGFRISRLFPIHDVHFPELVEMDVALIRGDQIKR